MKPINHPKVEMLAISMLTPNPRNARKHSDEQIGQIAASISRFGFLVPIIIDANGMIVAGHGRWMAAKLLGLMEVPVIRAGFMNDTDRRAFALAENRLAELSEFDGELLAEELEFLFEDGFDIETIGFSTSDLDFAIVEEEEEKSQQSLSR